MKLAWNIALRFLKSSKSQTVLIILGIAIGVSVQIFIGSLIDGLQVSLVDKTIGNSSQVTIVPSDKGNYFDADDKFLEKLNKDKEITAVSKSLDSSAFLTIDDDAYPILFRGMEFASANKIYNFEEKLIEGKIPSSNKEVMLGKDLIEDLKVKIGDTLDIVTADGKKEKVKLTGMYDLKVKAINESWIISNLKTAEDMFSREGKLSSIETQVKEVFKADIIAERIEKDLDSNLKITNWKEQNEELLSGLTGQSASSYLIQVFILLAVLLGIASVLAISVVQKSRQIGILKAMGIKNSDASLIFLFQGLMLGIIGSIIGTVLGLALTFIFSNFVKNGDGTHLVPFYYFARKTSCPCGRGCKGFKLGEFDTPLT
ncbi:lipoprotein-releasing system permease protein [Hathewaya proteolytica DSM 3090]|uniref:Lipoprotein-releasing system permease protein n=1 Tax=Hathewaya proteolytica DSM 3090 TaxID=1121331 RepID=A0A1M6RDA5_9CLOT|nr:ABC transporter permease [Hathewaya proteolytica]SHK30432.1 lipoprotein-releasing system permease protein [Hathewaya proteolytica DSM 3090]